MKFVFRRIVFALITLPVVAVAYGAIYFSLGLSFSNGSLGLFAGALPSVLIGYAVSVVFLPQITRLVDKVVA